MSSFLKHPLFLMSVCFPLMLQCTSHDLGHQDAERVPINLSLAGWENGTGEVIAKKCANCHTTQRSSFVPSNTPRSLDHMAEADFYKNKRNKVFLKSMKRRIEATSSEEGVAVMPPPFATPLYGEEKEALLAFLSARIKEFDSEDATPKPTVEPSPPPSPPPQLPLKFSDVEPIVAASCAKSGCHTGADEDFFALKTREDFSRRKPRPLNAIKRGSMPDDDQNFQNTPDGKKLIEWLSGPQTE